MAAYHLRRLSRPDVLRAIGPRQLESLLEPHAAYLARHGITLPLTDRNAPMKYLALAQCFIAPDEGMPRELMDALYFIDELATPTGVEALDNLARLKGQPLPYQVELTPAEIILQYWLANQSLVRTIHAQQAVTRFRAFEYYQPLGEEAPTLPEGLDSKIHDLEAALNDGFQARRCGRHAKILVEKQKDSLWMYVAHGGMLRRQAIVEESGPSSICYRPEVYDSLVLAHETGELGIYARSKGERELYRRLVGKHLFGEEQFFSGLAKYTLDPLWHYGRDALRCVDVPGIEWVYLSELSVLRPGSSPRSETIRGEDLFESWKQPHLPFPRNAHLLSVGFRMKMLGCDSPRRVTIRLGNQAQYTRDADRSLVERWIALRGFLRQRGDEGDADGETLLAVA